MDDDTLLIARVNVTMNESDEHTKERGKSPAPPPPPNSPSFAKVRQKAYQTVRFSLTQMLIVLGLANSVANGENLWGLRGRNVPLNKLMGHLSMEKGGLAMSPPSVAAKAEAPSWPTVLNIVNPRDAGACNGCAGDGPVAFDRKDPPPLPRLVEADSSADDDMEKVKAEILGLGGESMAQGAENEEKEDPPSVHKPEDPHVQHILKKSPEDVAMEEAIKAIHVETPVESDGVSDVSTSEDEANDVLRGDASEVSDVLTNEDDASGASRSKANSNINGGDSTENIRTGEDPRLV
eukprot:g1563.t1